MTRVKSKSGMVSLVYPKTKEHSLRVKFGKYR